MDLTEEEIRRASATLNRLVARSPRIQADAERVRTQLPALSLQLDDVLDSLRTFRRNLADVDPAVVHGIYLSRVIVGAPVHDITSLLLVALIRLADAES